MLQIELTKPLKKKLLMALPLALLLLLYLAGLLMQAIGAFPYFDGISFNPIAVLWLAASSRTGWMTVGGIAAALIFIFILAKWKDRALNNVAFTDERGIQFAKTGTYGVARPLRESELEAATADFTVGQVGKQDGYILGRLDTDQQEVRFLGGDRGQGPDPSSIKGRSGKRTISLKRQRKGNYNILVVGGSGSGKSAGFVRANILQAVKAGESVVVTDPVGELYTTFYKTFTEMGIECKAFNLAQPEFSDSWACLDEILDPVTGEPSEDRIADFATIIIENTGGQTKDPTHSMGQQQLLNALIHTLSYTVKTKTAKEYGALLDELEMTNSLPYTPAEWTKETMAEYILDPNGYVQKLANAYLAENQEKILYKFLYTDILWEAYQSVCSAPTDPVQKFRAIQDGLKHICACARNVHVTIRKNGINFTFRTDVEALRRSAGEIFNPWYIVAPDRQNFHHLFGEDSSYTIDEILCIEYARLVLYARDEKAVETAS